MQCGLVLDQEWRSRCNVGTDSHLSWQKDRLGLVQCHEPVMKKFKTSQLEDTSHRPLIDFA